MTTLVTVCAKCKRASCWQGRVLCPDATLNDSQEFNTDQLEKLNLESPVNWDICKGCDVADAHCRCEWTGG